MARPLNKVLKSYLNDNKKISSLHIICPFCLIGVARDNDKGFLEANFKADDDNLKSEDCYMDSSILNLTTETKVLEEEGYIFIKQACKCDDCGNTLGFTLCLEKDG